MATQLRCDTCGYTTSTDTPARADYAMRRHSCEKHLRKAAERNRRNRERQQRPVRECTHKYARHVHGDRAMYVLDKCRCGPCTNAARIYEKQRDLRQLRGQAAYVDTTEAVAHIRRLQAAGLGYKRIAELAGLQPSHVYPLLWGRPDRNGGRPRTKARATTVNAILAVPLPDLAHLADGAPVDATGTCRRLQALACLGWSIQRLADHAGIDRQRLDHALHHATIRAGTAKTVRALYDQLWATTAPTTTGAERQVAARTRNHATRNGWAPPLAWDDDTIDNPDAAPQLGNVRPIGKKRLHLDDVDFLLDQEPTLTVQQLADRIGVTKSALQAALARANRTDLLARLARNAEVAA